MICRLRIADLPCVCVYLHVCRYRLVPMGSFSKIIRTDDPNTAYELYGSQEFSLGKLFWYRRFDAVRVGMSTSLIWGCHVRERSWHYIQLMVRLRDLQQAMTYLLDSIHEFSEYASKVDPSFNPKYRYVCRSNVSANNVHIYTVCVAVCGGLAASRTIPLMDSL